MVRAIASAKKNENAWRSISAIATGSHILSDVRWYRIIANVANASGMRNMRFSPNASTSARLSTNMSAKAP